MATVAVLTPSPSLFQSEFKPAGLAITLPASLAFSMAQQDGGPASTELEHEGSTDYTEAAASRGRQESIYKTPELGSIASPEIPVCQHFPIIFPCF